MSVVLLSKADGLYLRCSSSEYVHQPCTSHQLQADREARSEQSDNDQAYQIRSDRVQDDDGSDR